MRFIWGPKSIGAGFQYISWRDTFLLFISLTLCGVYCADDVERKCNACRFLVNSFQQGLKETERAHFGGGNTAWEEKSLGKYARSETRLVEVLDYTCRDKSGKDANDGADTNLLNYKIDKNTQAQHLCQALLEEHEESVENWYFHKQTSDTDLYKYFCINHLKLCCPTGTFGKDCKPCPGDVERPCFGRGSCKVCGGGGTRGGTGVCKCDPGYSGKLCRKCASNYITTHSNDTHVTCEACHVSCRGGCARPNSSDACTACKLGFTSTDSSPDSSTVSCADIDECSQGIGDEGIAPCDETALEKCVNTVGSYRCDCLPGYKRTKGKCELDIAAAMAHAEKLQDNEMKVKHEVDDSDGDESEADAESDQDEHDEL